MPDKSGVERDPRVDRYALMDFLRESSEIEGIHREPTVPEMNAAVKFLVLPEAGLLALSEIQAVIAPDKPLRDKPGMNVRVGNHVAMAGGQYVTAKTEELLWVAHLPESNPWEVHCVFEDIHPFMDGNGRTGRLLWAWQMLRNGEDPFALPFLHRWYYQTLSSVKRATDGHGRGEK